MGQEFRVLGGGEGGLEDPVLPANPLDPAFVVADEGVLDLLGCLELVVDDGGEGGAI